MKVWLDDERPTPQGWERVYTAHQAIEMLAGGDVTEISLDHDLSIDHYMGKLDSYTGYAVVLWLENKVRTDPTFKMPIVHVHSMNPSGREHMLRGLKAIEQFLADKPTYRNTENQ